MLMHFHFGLGIGHVYSHLTLQGKIQQDNITVQYASTSHVGEDDEDARNSVEDNEGIIDDEDEDEDDDNLMVNPDEQWYGSSQELLVEQFEEMYMSEVELDYEN
ncbi:hypothetical protein EDD22DRAFT_851697 [Suillus occidentalis]|nr:hypothetical protein EDD22DRAFT_964709 [Suillus occidentalis]KAG1741374.1 hypothetical protein EDD22DRAFT_851697 [Suillus occidentalis]